MKNLYHRKRSNNSIKKGWQAIVLIAGLLVCANIAMAQTEMTWTGATSNNFRVEDNWNPAGSPSGNNLTLPLIEYDSVGNLLSDNDVCPVLSGSEDLTVKFIYMTGTTADTAKMRPLTINLDDNATLYSQNGGSKEINYSTCNIIMNSGNVYFDNYERFQENYRNWTINGGNVYCARSNRTMQIGNANNPTSGGQFIVNGGMLYIRAGGVGRAFYAREGGQFIIKGNGIIKLDGNYNWQQYIESGWINGGDDYYPILNYDAITNVTTIKAVPTDTVILRSNDTQELITGETANTLYLVLTNRVRNATSISWKYCEGNETTYTAFAGADSASFAPSFANAGTYHVIAEIVDANGITVQSPEIQYTVISDMIAISPSFDIQYIRVGEAGTQITATFKDGAVPSSMEWKYSTEIGGTYVSFSPTQMAATINPVFNLDSADTGKSYYMLLEATIDGQVYQSPKLQYVVEYQKTTGKSLTWTGLLSDDANDPGNWSPVASPFMNDIYVPVVESGVYPVFSGTENDSLYHFQCVDGATITFDGPEIIYVRGGGTQPYIDGDVFLKKGEMQATYYDTTAASLAYFNIRYGTSDMYISGDAVLRVNSLLMGNATTPTQGGRLYLTDNAQVYARTLDRVYSYASDSSVIFLSDNAKFFHYGDARTKLSTYIDSAKIRCPQEGYEPYILYNGEWTYVKARNTNSFSLDDDSRTFTVAGQETEAQIGLVNTDGITSWEWKWSANVNGPWNSFEPAATNVGTFSPSFSEAGDYYVIAVSSDDVETSNVKQVTAIELAITPAEQQNIPQGGTCNQLTLSLSIPEGLTLLNEGWFYADEFGVETSTGLSDSTYTPAFEATGIYQVYYYIEVQDENSVSYDLLSNMVIINYGLVSANQWGLNNGFTIYPNPTTGKFYIKGDQTEDYTLEIIDLAGHTVFRKSYQASNNQVVDFASKGAYVVKMNTLSGTKVSRLIVK